MNVVKDRSGITKGGDTYALSGSMEDLSYHLEGLNNDGAGVTKLRSGEKKLMDELRRVTAETPLSKNELVALVGMGDSTVRRLLNEMVSNKRLKIHREVDRNGVSGRPSYLYWAE